MMVLDEKLKGLKTDYNASCENKDSSALLFLKVIKHVLEHTNRPILLFGLCKLVGTKQ